jgi:hypothetical protein
MSKRKYNHRPSEYENCFYCKSMINPNAVGDHFPFPKQSGGEITVPCCESCHDMKDRFNLKDWPNEWLYAVVKDFPKMSRETKIFLAKAISIDVNAEGQIDKSKLGQLDKKFKIINPKLMLNVLSGYAANEYKARKQRVQKGVAKARKEDPDMKWGRPAIQFNIEAACSFRQMGFSWRMLSIMFPASYGTILRRVRPIVGTIEVTTITTEKIFKKIGNGELCCEIPVNILKTWELDKIITVLELPPV